MRYALAAPLALLASCSSETPAPTVATPAQPQGQASAILRLNAERSGTFDCSGGLFFVASVLNQTNAPLRVDTLAITFTKVSGNACHNHAAPVGPEVGLTAPPGVSTEIRRVDLAGNLCSAPYGEPGCEWLGKATLGTSFGTLTDEIWFRTTTTAVPPPTPAAPTTCPAIHWSTPRNGAVVEGRIRLECEFDAGFSASCPAPFVEFHIAGPQGYEAEFRVPYSGTRRFSTFWESSFTPNGFYNYTCSASFPRNQYTYHLIGVTVRN